MTYPGIDDFPISLMFNEAFQNVSNFGLEIEGVPVYPGHVWSPLDTTQYLTAQQTIGRGYATQKLIDLGYIARRVYIPIIPANFLCMQSIGGFWFVLNAIEVDSSKDTGSNPELDSVSYSLTAVSEPSDDSLIDFSIIVPPNIYFALQLDTSNVATMSFDDSIVDGIVWRKLPMSNNTPIANPIAILNRFTVSFQGISGSLNQLQITDTGEFQYTRIS